MPSPVGRPTDLTPAVAFMIGEYIGNGLNREDSALLSGVPSSTFFNWQARGKAAREAMLEGEPVPDSERPFLELLEVISIASGRFKERMIKQLIKAGTKSSRNTKTIKGIDANGQPFESKVVDLKAPNVQPLEWLLERKFPDEFGRTIKQDVQLETNAPPPVIQVIFSDDPPEGDPEGEEVQSGKEPV